MIYVLDDRAPYLVLSEQVGCVPSKALIKAASVAHAVHNCAEFGVTIEGIVKVDFGKVRPTSNLYVLGSHKVHFQLPAHGSSEGISYQ